MPVTPDCQCVARGSMRVVADAERVELGTNEPGSDQDKISGHHDFLVGRVVDDDERADATVTAKLQRLTRKASLSAFVMCGGRLEDTSQGGPGLISRPFSGRPIQDLDLDHRRGPVTMHRAETVGARIAATEDDDVKILCVNNRGPRLI